MEGLCEHGRAFGFHKMLSSWAAVQLVASRGELSYVELVYCRVHASLFPVPAFKPFVMKYLARACLPRSPADVTHNCQIKRTAGACLTLRYERKQAATIRNKICGQSLMQLRLQRTSVDRKQEQWPDRDGRN
jgi:hypothetical protein